MNQGNRMAINFLNWNTAALTLRSVEKISGWSNLNTGIVVVDNGSAREDLSLLDNGRDTFTLLT